MLFVINFQIGSRACRLKILWFDNETRRHKSDPRRDEDRICDGVLLKPETADYWLS